MGDILIILIITLTISSFILYWIVLNALNNSRLFLKLTDIEEQLKQLQNEMKSKK